MTTYTEELESNSKNNIGTQELISILDKLTEWAKGQEEKLVPVLEDLNN